MIEGVEYRMLAIFHYVMYQLANLMFESHETYRHGLDTSLDVLDVGVMLDGYSAGAALTLASVDLMTFQVWESIVSYTVIESSGY